MEKEFFPETVLDQYCKETSEGKKYEMLLRHIHYYSTTKRSSISLLNLIKDYSQKFGDLVTCHALRATELLNDDIPEYFQSKFSVIWDHFFSPHDKKEITQSLSGNVLEIKFPENIVTRTELSPGVTYYGTLTRCPLSHNWTGSGYEEIPEASNIDFKVFRIPVVLVFSYALYENHPLFSRVFRSGHKDRDSQGRSIGCFMRNLSIPLSWVTGEYRRISGMDNNNYFLQRNMPKDREDWQKILFFGHNLRDILVTDKILFSKLILANEKSLPYELKEFKKDNFNIWQEQMDNVIPFPKVSGE
jgi:hypothetical protein